MGNNDDFWYRTLFQLKVHKSRGLAFQQLVNDLFGYAVDAFEAIEPWGNWGDGGNDGMVEATGTYYQVYGPKPGTQDSPVAAVNKAVGDFSKLPEKWKNIRRYYFVYNDYFTGIPGPVRAALQGLKEAHGLEDTGAIVGKRLEELFISLEPDQRQMIVGGIPSEAPTNLDAGCVREIISFLADTDSMPAALEGDAPDLDEKIAFNGLSDMVGSFLKSHWYHVSIADQFFDTRDRGLAQAVATNISNLYQRSKKEIPSTLENTGDLRYVWMTDQLIPDIARKNIHSLKAYRQASQVILSKYFETCDAYEHPEQPITA